MDNTASPGPEVPPNPRPPPPQTSESVRSNARHPATRGGVAYLMTACIGDDDDCSALALEIQHQRIGVVLVLLLVRGAAVHAERSVRSAQHDEQNGGPGAEPRWPALSRAHDGFAGNNLRLAPLASFGRRGGVWRAARKRSKPTLAGGRGREGERGTKGAFYRVGSYLPFPPPVAHARTWCWQARHCKKVSWRPLASMVNPRGKSWYILVRHRVSDLPPYTP
jgi:hypothetical protein